MTDKGLSRIIIALLGLGVVLIPIDGIKGPGALGELGSLMCFPPLAVAVGLALYYVTFKGLGAVSGALVVGAAAMTIVACSAIANLASMQESVFHERSGLTKFVTSLLVIGYGFALAGAVESQPVERVVRILTRGVAVSVVVCLAFSAFEFAAKHGVSTPIYRFANSLLHSTDSEVNAWDGSLNLKVLYGWDPRLRSLSFEPPAFGNFTGFAWPWLFYGAVSSKRTTKTIFLGLLLLFTGLIIVSEARTGWLMLASNCVVAIALRTIYFTRGRHPLLAFARLAAPCACVAAVGLFALHFAMSYHDLVRKVVAGDSVSDLSRSASQIAAFRMFLDRPLFGFGLGQYAFNAMEYMPSWGFMSPEIWPNFTFPNAPWPAVYSVFARLAGELGILGLAGWIALWLGLFFRLIPAQLDETRTPSGLSHLGYPLAMNCLGVLVSGLATDTFRTPMIWISMGVCFAFIKQAKLSGRAAETRTGHLAAASPDARTALHAPLV